MRGDGEPWFIRNDVCDALGIGNPSDATKDLDAADKSGVVLNAPHGRPQEMAIISEPGLYDLIIQSRKPETKAFKRWITHDVLPSIRKTGGYLTPKKAIEAKINPTALDRIIQIALEKATAGAMQKFSQMVVEKAQAINRHKAYIDHADPLLERFKPKRPPDAEHYLARRGSFYRRAGAILNEANRRICQLYCQMELFSPEMRSDLPCDY